MKIITNFCKKKKIVNNQNTNENKFSNVSQFNTIFKCVHIYIIFPNITFKLMRVQNKTK